MNKKDLYSIRAFIPSDSNLILATWVHGLYHGNERDSWISSIPEDVFNVHYRNILEKIIILPHVEMRIATVKDEPDVILGYSVFTKDTLHWIYVKKPWRLIGIARDLYPKGIKYTTHLTELGRALRPKYKLIFDPFRLT